MVGASGLGALLMVDLDGFKYVNDLLGHSAGDEVLRAIAGRISSSARGGDLAIRLGGDEFALLLPNVDDPATAEQVAERVIAAASLPVQAAGQSVNVGASVGIAIYPLHGANEQDLLANADLALYKAKADGRRCSRFYHPGLKVEAHRRLSRDRELLQAVERNEFELFFQPQIRLADTTLAGAEVSLRWRHPELGLLGPEFFLPALENGGRAVEVGTWMIEAACVQAALWRQRMPHLRISLNLLGAQFRSGDLVGTVETALAATSLPPHALAVEVTETVLLQNGAEIVGPLRDLRARGVGVAVDNFGAGHAALGLLKRLPLTRLKIDPAFTQAMCGHPSDRAMVRAIIGLARACDLQVIADGIELQSQADLLSQDGCDEVQGALFCPALDAEAFELWTARSTRLSAKLPA